MWIRRTLSAVVVLGGLLPEWGKVTREGASSVVEKVAGWDAVVQQGVIDRGLLPLIAGVVWVVVFGMWLVLMSAGRARKDIGWDLGLLGLWGVLGAVWAQVLTVANGGFVGGEFRYFDLGFGFWLFLVGLVVSVGIRFIEVVGEMILESLQG